MLGLLKKEEELEERRMPNHDFLLRAVRNVQLRYIAILYTHLIGNQPKNTMVVFKIRDSVPSARYSSVRNVLRLWRISLIPTYRVYRLYDDYISAAKWEVS